MSTDFQPQTARRALDVLAAAQDRYWDLLDRDARQMVLQYRGGPIWCFSTKGSDVSDVRQLNEGEAASFLAKRSFKPASRLEMQIRSALRLHRESEGALAALAELFPSEANVRLHEKKNDAEQTFDLPVGVRVVARRTARTFDPELRWSAVERPPEIGENGHETESSSNTEAASVASIEEAPAAGPENTQTDKYQASARLQTAIASKASDPSTAQVRAAPAVVSASSAPPSGKTAFSSASTAPVYAEPAFSTRIPSATGDAKASVETIPVAWGATSETPVGVRTSAQPPIAHVPTEDTPSFGDARAAQGWGDTHADAPSSSVQHDVATQSYSSAAQQAAWGDMPIDAPADAPIDPWAGEGFEPAREAEVQLGPTWTPASRVPQDDAPQKKFPIGLIFLSWVFFVIFPLGLNWLVIAILWGFYFWKNRSKD